MVLIFFNVIESWKVGEDIRWSKVCGACSADGHGQGWHEAYRHYTRHLEADVRERTTRILRALYGQTCDARPRYGINKHIVHAIWPVNLKLV